MTDNCVTITINSLPTDIFKKGFLYGNYFPPSLPNQIESYIRARGNLSKEFLKDHSDLYPKVWRMPSLKFENYKL